MYVFGGGGVKSLFSNFIFAILFCFILTRIGNYFFKKLHIRYGLYIYLSPIIVTIVTLPFIAYFVGFDIVIVEYVFALNLCFVFDMLVGRARKR